MTAQTAFGNELIKEAAALAANPSAAVAKKVSATVDAGFAKFRSAKS